MAAFTVLTFTFTYKNSAAIKPPSNHSIAFLKWPENSCYLQFSTDRIFGCFVQRRSQHCLLERSIVHQRTTNIHFLPRRFDVQLHLTLPSIELENCSELSVNSWSGSVERHPYHITAVRLYTEHDCTRFRLSPNIMHLLRLLFGAN